MPAIDDLAAMRAPQGPEPTGPMAAPEGQPPTTAATPQYGDSRELGAAKAPASPQDMVPFGPIKVHPGIVQPLQALMQAVPGLTPVDGHRTDKEQKRANPMETESFHPDGTAVDFMGKADALQKGFMVAKMSGGHEVILHNSGRGYHLHVAWDPQEIKQQQAQQAPPPGAGAPPEQGPPDGGIVPPEQQAAEGPIPG